MYLANVPFPPRQPLAHGSHILYTTKLVRACDGCQLETVEITPPFAQNRHRFYELYHTSATAPSTQRSLFRTITFFTLYKFPVLDPFLSMLVQYGLTAPNMNRSYSIKFKIASSVITCILDDMFREISQKPSLNEDTN